jgi:hypothetical protein
VVELFALCDCRAQEIRELGPDSSRRPHRQHEPREPNGVFHCEKRVATFYTGFFNAENGKQLVVFSFPEALYWIMWVSSECGATARS